MSQKERSGIRDLSYSSWHRTESIARFVGKRAKEIAAIDIDFLEYHDSCKAPLALIETALDTGQSHKPIRMTLNLAKRAHIACYVVLYTLATRDNPADSKYKDIASLRVKRYWPKPHKQWHILTPQEWSEELLNLRKMGMDC